MENTEISTPVWELATLEKACEKHIANEFATSNGVQDLIFEYSNVWAKQPTKYAVPMQMFDAVRAWMRDSVWVLYTNYKFAGVQPDFNSVAPKPFGYFQIKQAAMEA